MAIKYVDQGALISPDGTYRYLLWREWRGTHDPKNWRWWGFKDGAGEDVGEPKSCVFIMLNPSTADGTRDDPTIRRCVAFAAAHKFERMEVVNLFAYRATSPKVLLALTHSDNPEGVDNQKRIYDATRDAGLVVCAWGAHGGHLGQDETVLGWVHPNSDLRCLGRTSAGFPRHPLYVAGSTSLEPFSQRQCAVA